MVEAPPEVGDAAPAVPFVVAGEEPPAIVDCFQA